MWQVLKTLITYQKIGIPLLLMALLLQVFNKTLLVGDYYLHTDRYAKNCENKLKTWLHCDGKCQLSKLIKKQQEDEKKQQEKRNDRGSEYYCFDSYSFDHSFIPMDESERLFSALPEVKTIEQPRSIFKPPIS